MSVVCLSSAKGIAQFATPNSFGCRTSSAEHGSISFVKTRGRSLPKDSATLQSLTALLSAYPYMSSLLLQVLSRRAEGRCCLAEEGNRDGGTVAREVVGSISR